MVAFYALAMGLVLPAGNQTLLLDFYSQSCGPCRQMAPVVQRLAAAGHPIRHIDVAKEPHTAAQFGVTAVPCFVMLVNGREVARHVGIASQPQLERMLALGGGARPGLEGVASSAPAPTGVTMPAVQSAPALVDLLGQSGKGHGPASARTPLPGWRMANPDPPPPPAGKPPEADLIAATVRIRVQYAGGQSCGSGTLIDARRGEALVLTCAHLFRESQGKGRIEVDIFAPHPEEKLPATLVHFDSDCDLGLISIRPGQPVRPARVAPPQYRLVKGARVYSAGCDGGAAPTVRAGVITALDRFLGPPNLTATGLPVEGRSGGGLFSAEGLLVGVCNAALPEEKEGFYAALQAIHTELDRANLAFVYRQPAEAPLSAGPMVAVTPPQMPKQMPPPEEIVRPTDLVRGAPRSPQVPAAPQKSASAEPGSPATTPPQTLSPEEKATLEELRRRQAEGAEIICVIRPRHKPDAPSEIVVLDRASPEFLRQLRTIARPDGPTDALAASRSSDATGAAAKSPVAAIASHQRQPATSAGWPAATADLPAATADLPATTADLPAATADLPATTADLPATTADLPATTADLPAAMAGQPATMASNTRAASELPEWKPRWLQPGYQGQ